MSHINVQGRGSFKIAVSWPTEVDYTLNPLVINKQKQTECPLRHWNWKKKKKAQRGHDEQQKNIFY